MFSIIRKVLPQVVSGTRSLHGIRLQQITEKYFDECMDHLRTVSYFDMPLYAAANLVGSGKPTTDLDNVYFESIKEGASLIALKNGKLAGVMINGILTPDAVPGAIESMKKSVNIDYKKMDYMFLQLLLEMDIFERFGIESALECRILSTTREFRGSGLGKLLVEKLTETARYLNHPMVVGEAVNEFLWKLLVAEGWQMIREFPYTDYIDEATGQVIFNVKPPHHVLGVCAKIVDERVKCRDPLPLPRKKIYYPIKMD